LRRAYSPPQCFEKLMPMLIEVLKTAIKKHARSDKSRGFKVYIRDISDMIGDAPISFRK
jgi:hypothetical protein